MSSNPDTSRPVIRIVRSKRKTMGIQIAAPGEVIVRAPLNTPNGEIRRLLEEQRGWIESHLEKAARQAEERKKQPALSAQEIHTLANTAMTAIPLRVRMYANQMKVHYGRITIRNQRTRWGSCSTKGNLNFNCLLMLCPADVIDYVIVHELCHRKEMNHSDRFWHLVESVLPDYKTPRKWLKEHGPDILSRMG